MLPMYVKYMGVEAYGLVGFYAMLSAWFQLLDAGLTPTMSREAARYNAGALDALTLRRLLRSLEGIFCIVAIFACGAMILTSNSIATKWLRVQQLPLAEVESAIVLMAFIISFRFISGLYRGSISGLERLVWLSNFNIILATLRFVIVIPYFWFVGASPVDFFAYQLVIGIVDLVLLASKAYSLLPKPAMAAQSGWQWAPIRNVLKFSLSIGFTSTVWVLITQTDKLVLSKLLPLADYAYFTLAVVLASGVILIGGPISAALLPRMTSLNAARNTPELIRVYRTATQCVSIVAVPSVAVLAFFSVDVLRVWTGDAAIAGKASELLTLYSLGNGFLALAAFPYYLQFAKGNLRLHLIGNAVFAIFLIPSVIWATLNYGASGAGWAWLANNAVCFLLWVPFVHRQFVPGLHVKWLLSDILPISGLALGSAYIIQMSLSFSTDRLTAGLQLAVVSLAVFTAGALGSSWLKGLVRQQYNSRGTERVSSDE